MTEPEDEVRARLARLSRALRVDPPSDDLVAAIASRIERLPVPAPPSSTRRVLARLDDRLRRHWRAATALALGLLLGLLAVSPAGARIAEWLGIGAVQIVQDGSPAAGPADPASADGFTEVTLAQARARATVPLAVPAELGPPTRVLVNEGATVVSMVWADGDPAAPGLPVRLDQVAGRPDYGVVKSYLDDVEFADVDGDDAFWLRVPHPLVYTDATGPGHSERSRTAGPTLIWTAGPVTLRLEGVPTKERALTIARSTG